MTIQQFKTNLLQVTREFQLRFDSDSKPSRSARFEILQSEINETLKAISENNTIEILDGFIDQLYVLGGSYEKFSFRMVDSSNYMRQIDLTLKDALRYFSLECLQEALIDIHNSNMSKVHSDIFQLIETFQKYRLDTDNFRVKRISDMQWFVYDLNINKLLKPLHYQKANLKPILEKYGYC